MDKLSSLTDANGQATTFEYDILGRLVREIDPLGNASSYVYDAKGNLTAKADGNGATIRYSYDVLGRLVKKLYPDQSEESFSYDARGNVLTAANLDAGYAFAYDTAGRLASVTDQLGRAIRYEYDQSGRKSKMTGPDGNPVNYEYDSAGRLGKIRSGGDFVFGYDQSGRRVSLSYPNGVVANYTYDQGSRLSNLTHRSAAGVVISTNSYTLDQIGNRLTNQTPARTLSYRYDDLYRLTEALSSTPGNSTNSTAKGKGIATATQQQKEFFTYDPVGNRLTSDTTPLYTYNGANQLLTNGGDYSYDKNGNLVEMVTSDGTTLYAWDYENRLKQVTLPDGNIVTFKYDPMGRRIEKSATESGVTSTTRYLYDNEDILLETDATGKVTNRYLHGPGIDETLALVQGKNAYYYHADGLGSIVALTDSKGKVAQEYQYDSFGNLHDQMNRVKQPYTYTGREWDRETGLYYYRARYYDAGVGRFISEDPIGFDSGDVNSYAYVAANPVSRTDPTGLIWIYQQITGNMYYQSEPTAALEFVASGYSGHGVGLNNPLYQYTTNIGPIPRGRYDIGPLQLNITSRGVRLPDSMRLSAIRGTYTGGRGGFLIHGGNMITQSSSAGCIVLPLAARNKIGSSCDNSLLVTQ